MLTLNTLGYWSYCSINVGRCSIEDDTYRTREGNPRSDWTTGVKESFLSVVGVKPHTTRVYMTYLTKM
jgi:hypothetical protein